MNRIRVLVVDDVVAARRVVSQAITSDPLLEVVGTAPNGRIALAKIAQLSPDVVTLDLEMPEMDGLETLAEIRKQYPGLPVIMFSCLTERGAEATLDALSLGATDYILKPSCRGLDETIEVIRRDLGAKIYEICGSASSQRRKNPTPALRPLRPLIVRPRVVAIAVSTGGPRALNRILSALPSDFPVPLLVVQHMPPQFTTLFAERLDELAPLRVREGTDGAYLQSGEVTIAPGDFHLQVAGSPTRTRLVLDQAPPENSCRPSADVLFRSVARVFGTSALALVLTGMGQDGLHGCAAIRNAGGVVLAQDRESSVVWGMPGSVTSAGLADKVIPLDQVSDELTALVCEGSWGCYPGTNS